MASFQAGTQYGDWNGTAAADEPGTPPDFEELFEETGEVQSDEIMIAFEIYAGEGSFYLAGYFHKESSSNSGGQVPSLAADFEVQSGPIFVRKVEIEMTLKEFFSHFKRFNVVLARKNLKLTGREYEVLD